MAGISVNGPLSRAQYRRNLTYLVGILACLAASTVVLIRKVGTGRATIDTVGNRP